MPDGTSHSPEQTEATARSVRSIVKNAEPTKSQAETAADKAREAMTATIKEMRAARARVGNFVVSFDTPETPSDILLFATPVQEPYTGDDLTHQTASYVSKNKGYTSSYVLVMATPDGFYAHDLHKADMSAIQEGTTTAEKERSVQDFLRGAVYPSSSGNANSNTATAWGSSLTIRNTHDYAGGRFDLPFYQQAEPALVEKALKASIATAQKEHRPTITRATQTMEAAQAVQAQLGGRPSESAPVPASEPEPPRRGLFRRR